MIRDRSICQHEDFANIQAFLGNGKKRELSSELDYAPVPGCGKTTEDCFAETVSESF